MREEIPIDPEECIVPLSDRAADRYIMYYLGEPVLTIDLLDRKSILTGIAFIEMALGMEEDRNTRKKLELARNDLHVRYESLPAVKSEKENS